jgi:hypothetical protein
MSTQRKSLSNSIAFSSILFLALCVAALAPSRSFAGSNDSGHFAIANTFHIGGPGAYGYVAFDSERKLLYIPRRTHTQVVDATSGKVIADIPGQQSNRGVALDPASGRGFISDRGEGYLVIFDLRTNAVLGKLPINGAPDEIINDAASRRIYLACGSSECLIPVPVDIDPRAGKPEPPIDLRDDPHSLVSDGAGKIYLGLGYSSEVAVVDSKARKLVGKWSIAPARFPSAIAVDTQHRRLFVHGWRPEKLMILSTENGRVLCDFPIGERCSALTFDDGYLFALCQDGLNIVKETSTDKFEVVQRLKTPLPPRHYELNMMTVDHATHSIYLPAVEEIPVSDGRQRVKPDSFEVVVTRLQTSQR